MAHQHHNDATYLLPVSPPLRECSVLLSCVQMRWKAMRTTKKLDSVTIVFCLSPGRGEMARSHTKDVRADHDHRSYSIHSIVRSNVTDATACACFTCFYDLFPYH